MFVVKTHPTQSTTDGSDLLYAKNSALSVYS